MQETNKIITLDQLLEKQSSIVFSATVEVIPGDPDSVKVTPWIPERGCSCDRSFTIPKDAISSVELTNHEHFCCGKILQVVHLTFNEDVSLPISEVFSRLIRTDTPRITTASKQGPSFTSFGMGEEYVSMPNRLSARFGSPRNSYTPIQNRFAPGRNRYALMSSMSGCGPDCQPAYYGCGSCGQDQFLVKCFCSSGDYEYCDFCD